MFGRRTFADRGGIVNSIRFWCIKTEINETVQIRDCLVILEIYGLLWKTCIVDCPFRQGNKQVLFFFLCLNPKQNKNIKISGPCLLTESVCLLKKRTFWTLNFVFLKAGMRQVCESVYANFRNCLTTSFNGDPW